MKNQHIKYKDRDTTLIGYVSCADNLSSPRPAVLICHPWRGRDEFVEKKARMLADLGYVGFAIDLYGDGKTGTNNEENAVLMQPFIDDREYLLKRLLAAYDTLKNLSYVDKKRIAVMGFCFGGLCALDLARSGTDIQGAISFHGLLFPPAKTSSAPIKAKILAMHGYDDPMVKPDQVLAFADEMTKRKADWEIDMYGHTMHAFTNPNANDPGFGTVYNATAEKRSLRSMENFLEEIFKQ